MNLPLVNCYAFVGNVKEATTLIVIMKISFVIINMEITKIKERTLKLSGEGVWQIFRK